MSFLPSLSGDAKLLDVFKRFPTTARPLLEYHEVLLRGPSPLSIAERELLAAYVSGLNACQFCHGVHTATAENYGIPEGLLRQLLDDLEQAPIDARMKPLLAFVKTLTFTPNRMCQEDADRVFAAGWDEQALHDAVSVCALFNFMNRFVDGLGIRAHPGYFTISSQRLSSVGYLALSKLLNQ